jgi:hypothetical protein
MHRTTKRAAKITAFAAVAFIASAGVANASVTVTDGTGFVGKGDVQTLLGWNNQTLQKNAESLRFTTVQEASQALSQSVTQDATQAGTQSVSQDVTCTLATGQKTFHRDGERDGSRTGSHSGTRTGNRAGTLNGNISYTVAYEARKANQFTGFNLNGVTGQSTFVPSGAAVYGAPSWGDYAFGDYTFGEVVWGGWDAAPGENPADCLGGNPGVTDLVNDITKADPIGGAIIDGDIAYGATTNGALTSTGPAALYVNEKALPNTPTV